MDWALKGEALAKIDAVVQRFEPKDPLLLHSNLFDDWMPHVPGVADDDVTSVEAARARAVKVILESGGIDAIVELTKRVKVPPLIVPALASAAPELTVRAIARSTGRPVCSLDRLVSAPTRRSANAAKPITEHACNCRHSIAISSGAAVRRAG